MSHRKRRRRGSRRAARITTIVTLLALLVGAIGAGVWLYLNRRENYPMAYEALIRRYAAENGLEPAYVAAVILAESSYNPQNTSPDNAQGLMQLLPSTAKDDVSVWLGETYVDGCLYDPETNIRYGCRYLGWLMERYGQDKRTALAGYHAGPGTVGRWLQDLSCSDDGRTLKSIPDDSPKTGAYVNRVMRYYEKYTQLYET